PTFRRFPLDKMSKGVYSMGIASAAQAQYRRGERDMAQAFFGGIYPYDHKADTSQKTIEQMPPGAQVVLPMSLHIGAPCRPCVAVGDHVKMGQVVGEPAGFVSAPVHASVSGTVVAVEPRPHFSGVPVMSV